MFVNKSNLHASCSLMFQLQANINKQLANQLWLANYRGIRAGQFGPDMACK